MSKIETGISSFDKISGGGLPIPSALALMGNVGSAKEIFVRQIVWNFLQKGSKVLYYSISQSAEDLRTDMKRFNWDIAKYEKKRLLIIEDIFTRTAETMTKQLQKKILSDSEAAELTVQEDLYDLKQIAIAGIKFMPVIPKTSKPRLIVFDSLSPIISTNTKGTSQMVHSLRFATRLTKTIGIGLMHTKIHDSKIEETFKSLADGIIEINEFPNGVNTLSISKYIGEYKKGPYPIEVDDQGINIIPIVMIEFFKRQDQINI